MARRAGTFGDIRTSPRNQKLLKWLRRKPVPHTIVGENPDGEERKAVVSLTGPTIWQDVLSVVRDCVHLEARDKEGQTLRALDIDADDPELQAEIELEAIERRAVGVAGSVPLISVDIPRLVDNLARNMREVAAEAAKQQAGAFKEGFAAMTSVVNLCLGLLMRVDERMANLEDEARTVPTTAEPPQQNQREQLAMMALQRAMGGGNGAAPNGGGLNMAQLLQMVQSMQQNQPPAEGE